MFLRPTSLSNMLRTLLTALFLCSLPANSQVAVPLIPAAKLGLVVSSENGATIFRNSEIQIVYVLGLGWAAPLEATLPAPVGDKLPLPVVRAAGLIQVPEAELRLRAGQGKLRLVLDLPADWPGPKIDEAYPGKLQLEVPYFVPGLEYAEFPAGVGLEASYQKDGTRISFTAPAGRIYKYRTYSLTEPSRYVIDLYYLMPETTEPLAEGVRYRELWVWTPEPVRLFVLEAEAGKWKMEPVGRPGQGALLSEMAPQAVALLNGGYFDNKTFAPIGLWIKNGVALSFPYGRSALLWQENQIFAGFPKFSAYVTGTDGKRYPVGINSYRARLTAHTITGLAGRPGENLLVVDSERVVGSYPAPYELSAGKWGLSYPAGSEPPSRVGETLKLYGNLDPPFPYALEAGPLLIQSGVYAFDPKQELFNDQRPLHAVAQQSVVAWTQEGKLWLLVSEPTTPDVLARALEGFGLWGAIRMDGGGSAQLWVKGALRSPLTEARPRRVVSGLALYLSNSK